MQLREYTYNCGSLDIYTEANRNFKSPQLTRGVGNVSLSLCGCSAPSAKAKMDQGQNGSDALIYLFNASKRVVLNSFDEH